MEAAVTAPAPRARTRGGPLAILSLPTVLLVVFFLIPMLIMVQMAFLRFPPNTSSGYTPQHFTDALTNHTNWKIAIDTFVIASLAQAVMLAIALPLGYFMAFRAGRWELPLLLGLVLADELNPVVKTYAWQAILGRNGVVNKLLQSVHVIDHPITWLFFSRFAVIVVLAAGYLTYTTIPIYAAMKAINPSVFEAAVDLGAGWWVKARRVLVPLAAPGIFIAIILVYIPMLTDFVAPNLVGGTSVYMLGQRAADLILQGADWGDGAALNFVLLLVSIVVSLLAYRLSRLHRLETSS
jgi:spermidine/putrescine transport system permease protein